VYEIKQYLQTPLFAAASFVENATGEQADIQKSNAFFNKMWSKLGPFDLQAQANAYHQQKGTWPQLYPDNAIGANQAALGLAS
jgi:hypothetical protein